MAFCTTCGAQVQGPFCGSCGAPAPGSAAQPPGAPGAPPVTPAAPSVAPAGPVSTPPAVGSAAATKTSPIIWILGGGFGLLLLGAIVGSMAMYYIAHQAKDPAPTMAEDT